MTMITSVSMAVSVLGGTNAVAKMLNATSQSVSNWRRTDRFPANSYVTVQGRLHKLGMTAPDSLWPMKGAKKTSARKKK